MKKALFQLFLLVIPFAGLQAQLQIGLTGSVNGRVIMHQNNYGFSKLAYKPVTGIGYGVFVGYRFGENSKHSVNLEISSMALGQAYEEEISKNNISNNISNHFLSKSENLLLFQLRKESEIDSLN